MSSPHTASIASTASLAGYLDRVYDQNRKKAELAYANHMIAAKELQDALTRMMSAKKAIRGLNDELAKAIAAAATATELVDRKRKAADAAAADFEFTSQMTREYYGTEAKRPFYHRDAVTVSPVYSKSVYKKPRQSR
jgi:hypothetical protein